MYLAVLIFAFIHTQVPSIKKITTQVNEIVGFEIENYGPFMKYPPLGSDIQGVDEESQNCTDECIIIMLAT